MQIICQKFVWNINKIIAAMRFNGSNESIDSEKKGLDLVEVDWLIARNHQ